MRQAGLVVISGRHLTDRQRAFVAAADDVRIELRGSADDGALVRAALDGIDALVATDPTATALFLLSYEACVALCDRRLPRKPRDAALGPDVLVRVLRPTDLDGVAGPFVPSTRAPAAAAHAAHLARVTTCHERLLDGVIYQANLAHRLVVERASHDEALAFFLAQAPAPPCAAFVDVPGWGSVVSLSPERFVHVDDGDGDGDDGARVARTFPIKGTRPRGATADLDARLVAELCASTKDAAEHVMIVDLLRNDLGRVAKGGGVTVERLLEVISVKNVHHLESTISAQLRDDVDIASILGATVPGGSITGAPKSSAVETIFELEDGPRGLYTGVLGVVDGGVLRSSLLIRTWLRPDDADGSLHVGGGIVVDSVAEDEWQETLDKAAAFGPPR